MGLSRNKVAVSEGAAGSPPFYGERVTDRKVLLYSLTKNDFDEEIKTLIECCSIFSDEELLRRSWCYKRRGSTCTHSEHRS